MSDLPFRPEDLLSSIVDVLKIQGDTRAITVLLESDCNFDWKDQDFGIDCWQLSICISNYIFFALNEEERSAIEETLLDIARPFFAAVSDNYLRSLCLFPKVSPATESWRDEALRFVKGEGVTNQGRVRSDNIASKEYKGLLFRSNTEIVLFKALIRAKLAVAPLPVFVRISDSYNRLEPDFLVVYNGLTFVIEVDGDSYHKEFPVEADDRLNPLTREGVEVRRISASELDSDSKADLAVRKLIQFMDSRKKSR